ncbi:MAG: hypothetical protein E7160_04360 [Firmicutes bacterium]|nr:hypothetical protein [Bacillota bacterium]
MSTRKSLVFPFIITLIILGIIVYLFMNVKQPYVECDKTTTFDGNIKISESLKTTLNGNKIDKLELIKVITLNDTKHINSVKNSLKDAYKYLGKDAKISTDDNKIIIKVVVDDNETILLNNISFNGENSLEIENNTKSSNVVSLKVNENYTEGELITRLRNNGYACR